MKFRLTRDWKGYRAGKILDVKENDGGIAILLRRGIVEAVEEPQRATAQPQQKKRGKRNVERAVKSNGNP